MPQLEQQQHNSMGESYSYESAQPQCQGIIAAWGTAIRDTVALLKPAFGPNFLPISMGLFVGWMVFDDFSGKHGVIPYSLVCGSAVLITKIVPTAVCPIFLSYFVMKKIRN